MTLWFVPQWPVKNRYPEEWIKWFPNEMEKQKLDYMTVKGTYDYGEYNKVKGDMFTSLIGSSDWEMEQIMHLLRCVNEGDTVFFADLDFPGFILPCMQLLKCKLKEVKLTGYLHAGSYIEGDYFEPVADSKILSEQAMYNIVDTIFVASEYHKDLFEGEIEWDFYEKDKVKVVKIPYYKTLLEFKRPHRKWDVCYTSRIDEQKSDKQFLEVVKNMPNRFFVTTNKPSESLPNLEYHPVANRKEYFDVLDESKVLFVPYLQATFGYNVLEALDHNCIPYAPEDFAYPEILDEKYLYHGKDGKWLNYGIERFINDDEDIIFDFSPYENCISKILDLIK